MQSTYCVEQCLKALKNAKGDEKIDVEIAVDFLLQEMAALDPRPKGSCTVTATVLWSALTQYPLNKLFASPGSLTPDCILDGAIVCINVPLSMGSSAKMAFVLWKVCVQKMLLGRIPR